MCLLISFSVIMVFLSSFLLLSVSNALWFCLHKRIMSFLSLGNKRKLLFLNVKNAFVSLIVRGRGDQKSLFVYLTPDLNSFGILIHLVKKKKKSTLRSQ